MNDSQQSPAALAAQGLHEVAEEFTDAIGRKPSSNELFEILMWAIKSGPDGMLADVNPANIIALKPQIKNGAKRFESWTRSDDTEAAVADLNDATFVVASDFLRELTNIIKNRTGQPPTLDDLCRLLVEGLHQCDDDLLVDISPMDIVGIKAEVRKQGKISVKVGDIVAIPAKNGEYFIAIILAKNVFGLAYGLFEGTSNLRPVSIHSHPPVRRHPIYSGAEFIANGRWKIIGHDEELQSLFPAEPEIYHRKQAIPGAPELEAMIGPYGSGETASGRLRDLTKEEAEEVGLLSGEYEQIYLPGSLEKYLNAKLE
jgi:hypothetical protein